MLKNLKILRNKNNITQQQLADIISVSQQSINKYENQNIEPDISTLIALADYFDVSVDYLIGRTSNEKNVSFDFNLINETESKIICKLRLLNKKQREVVISLINSYLD